MSSMETEIGQIIKKTVEGNTTDSSFNFELSLDCWEQHLLDALKALEGSWLIKFDEDWIWKIDDKGQSHKTQRKTVILIRM